MHLRHTLLCGGFVFVCLLVHLTTPALAGIIGFPAARQQPFHFRLEVGGDSFREDLHSGSEGDAEAKSGRGLITVALGLTEWSEVFARIGMAEFNSQALLFSGDFGIAYGGGVRLRLLTFPLGVLGVSGQYLRFTSDDDNSAGVKVEGTWEEFDVAVGVGTKRTGMFEFYAGVAYHESDITLEEPGSNARTTLESDIPFRLFLGVHLYPLRDVPSGKFLLNVEARFIGETPQFTLGAQYVF